MPRATITLCKFVGTISLGLLTGQSLTLNLTLLPTIGALPTSPSAQKPYTHLAALARRQTALLSSISATAFLLAYTLSSRRNRHPYLLYATFAIAGGWVGEAHEYIWGSGSSKKQSQAGGAGANTTVVGGGSSASSSGDEEWEVDASGLAPAGDRKKTDGSQSLNGEVVRDGLERWRKRLGIKAGVWGFGWVLAVVGLWGDGV